MAILATNLLSATWWPKLELMGPDVTPYLPTYLQDYLQTIDVTRADEDSNSIPTYDVNRAILGNVAKQVAPPGGQN